MKAAKAEMAKYQISYVDFMLMRMSSVRHDIDVSAVDQTVLAWFLTCDFAKGLWHKSRCVQSGSKRQVS